MRKSFFLLVSLLTLAACTNSNSSQSEAMDSYAAPVVMPTNAPVLVEDTNNRTEQIAPQSQVETRLIIRDANLTLTVEDATETAEAIKVITEDAGGWVVTSNLDRVERLNANPYTQGRIQVRVPADRLDSVLEQIRELAITVDRENIASQDVTSEFVDLNSRVKNLEAAEEQLQEIMNRAGTIEEVLQVHNQLVETRGEIETAQGRITFLSQSAAYSSISIQLQREEPPVEEVKIEPEPRLNLSETAENASDALLDTLASIIKVVVWVGIYLLPLVLLTLITLVLGLRLALFVFGGLQRFFRKKTV